MRWSRYVLGLLIGLAILSISQIPGEKLKMVACDVGQGDGILLIKGNIQIVVDGGSSQDKILTCLERYVPHWDRELELIVMTNSDKDHAGGLIGVVERYEVIQFVSGDGLNPTDTMMRLVEVLQDRGVEVVGVEQGDVIRVGSEERKGGIELRVLWPDRLKSEKLALFTDDLGIGNNEQILGSSDRDEDVNERSVVMELRHDGYKILLTGDSGIQTEKELLRSGLVGDVDVLKVGHHGSKFSSSLEFLEIVRPEMAIISVGKNSYGHPTGVVIENLNSVGAEIMRTDEDGNVVVEIGD